ncbi:MAG: SatD family protein [Muribaculaceae bacterium]|nr:SatD family protein [Muribaculaceae bacterium]
MKIGAIITGDIIDSTALVAEQRELMLAALRELPAVLSAVDSNVSLEIFRGDSFQLHISDTPMALRAGVAIRAWLRSQILNSNGMVLDARLAIGIGKIDFESGSLATSDGEAFRLSGRLLDEMTKSRLEIRTMWEPVNEQLKVATAFADDIISSWTASQSKIILRSLLTGASHRDVAGSLGVSRQMVTKSLKSSKEELISNYIVWFEKLITEYLNKQ